MLQIQRNDVKYSVRLFDTNLADDGNYTCLVSNELGTISRTFTVNIVGNQHASSLYPVNKLASIFIVLNRVSVTISVVIIRKQGKQGLGEDF